MECRKEEEEDFGHVQERGYTHYLERDSGKDNVIIIRISIINIYLHILNYLFFRNTS